MGVPSRARAADGASPEAVGVRNVIFMVSDGMSAGATSLAEDFARQTRGTGTRWYDLAGDPRTARGFLETASLSSMITDSAAAASAWGTGSRVANGAINVLPDGTRLTPIAQIAKSTGRAVGLVTTTTVTHATPAGFATVEADRRNQAGIAKQYLDLVDVAMGGGHEHFAPDLRSDGLDLYDEFRRRGYAICSTRAELRRVGVAPKRVLGVFSTGHMPYTIDELHREDATPPAPTLAEMTRAALACLAGSEHGFLLQIEGGRVDHAGHNNDAAALLHDQLAFDDAIEPVLAFLERHPDTLVIITTDHGNANPGLNGIGRGYADSDACFARLQGCRASFPAILAALRADAGEGQTPAAARIVEIVEDRTGIAIDPAEALVVADALAGAPVAELNAQHRGFVGVLGQALGNHNGIAFTGVSHTNDLAMLLALGAGRDRFAGVMHHTDVFTILTQMIGAPHENPKMSMGDARRFLAKRPPADAVHWT
jgi:alkaline phosphatase